MKVADCRIALRNAEIKTVIEVDEKILLVSWFYGELMGICFR